LRGFYPMKDVSYYREQAARARRLAKQITRDEVAQTLVDLAVGYEDIAEDLERGLVEIRHPELLPQHEH
jgi:hypothetical protein